MMGMFDLFSLGTFGMTRKRLSEIADYTFGMTRIYIRCALIAY
jgi:hypothetical protein